MPNQTLTQMNKYVLTIELFRDGVTSPWGFRLRGGADVDGGTPLQIIKVFVGSASEGLLLPGDKILSINSQDTGEVDHSQAQLMFKTSGTSAKIEVARTGSCQPEIDAKLEGQMLGRERKEEVQCGQQPYRTSTLLMPAPRTFNEAGGGLGYIHHPHGCQAGQPAPPSYSSPSPDRQGGNFHPGYVQASPPQLPFNREATLSKPQESETFKMIMRSEMVSAKDQSGIDAKRFDKHQHNRPLSQLSGSSDEARTPLDPVLKNTSINQSTTFKKLMQSVMGETEF